MNRAELDAWFAQADDVLTDWPGSIDSMTVVVPDLSFDCPEFPTYVSRLAACAHQEGIDGWAAQALIRRWIVEESARRVEAVRASFAALAVSMCEASEKIAAIIRDLSEAMTGEGQPPADPRGRALWLRQHRNTGPEQPSVARRRRVQA